jgi:hypothetical protein
MANMRPRRLHSPIPGRTPGPQPGLGVAAAFTNHVQLPETQAARRYIREPPIHDVLKFLTAGKIRQSQIAVVEYRASQDGPVKLSLFHPEPGTGPVRLISSSHRNLGAALRTIRRARLWACGVVVESFEPGDLCVKSVGFFLEGQDPADAGEVEAVASERGDLQ